MKKIYLLLLTLFCGFQGFGETKGTGLTWVEDWKVAKAQAVKENKDIFLFFTGSDWCSWCHALQKEVFEDPQFLELVSKKYVFMMADFPQGRPLSAQTIKQNETLQEKYRVEGYPTVYLLDAKTPGDFPGAYAKTGYQAGGGEVYGKMVVNFQGKRDIIRTLQGEIDKGKTEREKAIKINELFSLLEDNGIEEFYKKDLMDKLKALKSSEAGDIRKKFEFKTRLNSLTESWTDKIDWRGVALKDLDKLLYELDKYAGEVKNWDGKTLLNTVAQDILVVKASVLIQVLQAREEGVRILKEAKARAPDSRFGKTADALIEQIEGK